MLTSIRISTDFLGRFLNSNTKTMIALQDTEIHLQRRRPWIRGLSATAVKEYEGITAHRVRMLVDRLREQKGMVRLEKWFDKFS